MRKRPQVKKEGLAHFGGLGEKKRNANYKVVIKQQPWQLIPAIPARGRQRSKDCYVL